jgi:hypothetical protein
VKACSDDFIIAHTPEEAVDRLAAIAATRPGSDGTVPTTETLRRDVMQWADEGPVAAKG